MIHGVCCVVYYYTSGVPSELHCVFFFQAEDGIRDLVRSRGLGDVYKRQKQVHADIHQISGSVEIAPNIGLAEGICDLVSSGTVSYTHLTLPTSDLV